ncbi:MAG: dihydrofolate reductase [Candidatus Marinimicrobia bacterium]|jgi:dihydrofolate reductase|nr:dihydrofolate reductase [Candidatus Neomarinimicrobiota bacterium]
MKKIIIVAMTKENIIGKDNNIPWHISDDLKLFKKNTINNTIIMGRKTYESIGKPLPKRNNIVVSSKLKVDNEVKVCDTFEKAINLAENLGKDIFFIGGNQIYKSALKIADHIYLSLVKGNYSGNVYFPEYDKKDWQMIDSKEYDKFTFIRYRRIF